MIFPRRRQTVASVRGLESWSEKSTLTPVLFLGLGSQPLTGTRAHQHFVLPEAPGQLLAIA